MGLFDSLFGSKPPSTVEVLNDRIWMSQQAKFNGLRKELEERAGSGTAAVLLVAHFADTLERLHATVSDYHGNAPVTAVLAEKLSADIAARSNFNETATIDLIVAERHPLLAVDDQVTEFAKGLPCRCRVAHHLSLDDPLLKCFAGEWVASVLEKLGMKEDEPIDSKMVSRNVTAALRKLQAQASGDSEARSAAEWMEKNMPNTSKT